MADSYAAPGRKIASLRMPAMEGPLLSGAGHAATLRVGFVGTDTSHVIAFAEIMNDQTARGHVEGARVVAAYKGGSPDIEKSYGRVDKFAEQLASRWGVEIVADIPELCSKVDAVMIESVDGRAHLEQARQVIAAHKPLYIDKPLAATFEDAIAIAKLAKNAGVPWFSSSSLRFSKVAASLKFSDAAGYIVWGPGPLEEHHTLDLAWYGIHSADFLYALMGTGCQEVIRTFTVDADVTTCVWSGGRIGTMRVNRPYSEFGAVAFRPREVVRSAPSPDTGYAELVREVVTFFQTGKPPVSPEETLEVFAFMDAAQRSREAGGRPVRLRDRSF
jgi:hypothetical protein